MSTWLRVADLIAGMVFPGSCPACGRPLQRDEGPWCLDCAGSLLTATQANHCPRCGQPVGPYLRDPAGCRECRREPQVIDGFARVAPYDTMIGDMDKRYKYQGRERLAAPLGALLAGAITGQPWADDIDALVPVPPTWRSRVRYRGRPVERIATTVGRKLALPVLPIVYVRGKKKRQAGLPRSARPENVRGVFHVHPRARPDNATLCVVDDVSTSGATAREMARTLKASGATRVYVAVVAKTNPNIYLKNAPF